MVDPFQIVIQRLTDLGIFSFFIPWIITAAVMWGLLKRSKIFDPAINAVLSIAISFFIWGYLANTAFNIGTPLAIFITQGFVFMLVFVFALIGASMFYPKFPDTLSEVFKGSWVIWMFVGLFVGALFFTSGLYKVLIPSGPSTGAQGEVQGMVVMLVALIVGVLILVGVQRGLGKKE